LWSGVVDVRSVFVERDETRLYQSGFTLVEVLAVVVIVSILTSIAVPAVGHLIEIADTDVCEVNRSEVSRLYYNHLYINGVEHSDALFLEFIKLFEDTCPVGGSYSFVGGEVVCSLHQGEDVGKSDDER